MRLREVKSLAGDHTDGQRQSLELASLPPVPMFIGRILPPRADPDFSCTATAHLIEIPEKSFKIGITPLLQMRTPGLKKGK